VYEGLSVLLLGVVVATVVAVIIGYVCLKKFGRGSDPSLLALTTLAFSQMFYFLVWTPLADLTGGSDGLLAVPTPPLTIPGVFSFSLDDPYRLYFFVMVVFLICAWIMKRIIYSPFGRVIHGIRENELRVSFLGYNTFRFKLIAFTLSGPNMDNLKSFLSDVLSGVAAAGGWSCREWAVRPGVVSPSSVDGDILPLVAAGTGSARCGGTGPIVRAGARDRQSGVGRRSPDRDRARRWPTRPDHGNGES